MPRGACLMAPDEGRGVSIPVLDKGPVTVFSTVGSRSLQQPARGWRGGAGQARRANPRRSESVAWQTPGLDGTDRGRLNVGTRTAEASNRINRLVPGRYPRGGHGWESSRRVGTAWGRRSSFWATTHRCHSHRTLCCLVSQLAPSAPYSLAHRFQGLRGDSPGQRTVSKPVKSLLSQKGRT